MNKDRIIADLRRKLQEAEEEIDYNVSRKEELKRDIEDLEEQLSGARDMYGSYMDQCKNLANSKREIEARLGEISLEKCKLAEANRINLEEISKLRNQNKTVIENNIENVKSLKEERKELEKQLKTDKEEYCEQIKRAKEKIMSLKNKISSILKCENCGQVFNDELSLQNHFKMFHILNKQNRREDKRVKCSECSKPFYTKDDLQ